MEYDIIKNQPVAKFFYKGTHSHPVKRTVFITENERDYIKGYEVREGTDVRDVDDAPVKTFRKDKIATTSQLRTDNPLWNKKDKCTLTRMSISQLDECGV